MGKTLIPFGLQFVIYNTPQSVLDLINLKDFEVQLTDGDGVVRIVTANTGLRFGCVSDGEGDEQPHMNWMENEIAKHFVTLVDREIDLIRNALNHAQTNHDKMRLYASKASLSALKANLANDNYDLFHIPIRDAEGFVALFSRK